MENIWLDREKLDEDLYFIKQEIEKDIRPILKEDPKTANFLKDVVEDYKISSYMMFKWLNFYFNPRLIFYPASGFDRVPKIAFGKEKVVHTSLEGYEEGGQKYFDQLGDGIRVIADNNLLPFKSSMFDIILLLDSSYDIACQPRNEFARVLKKNGVIVFARNIFQDDMKKDRVEFYKEEKTLKGLSLSYIFTNEEKNMTKFYFFRKA